MALQKRIMHAPYLGMLSKELSNSQRIIILPLNPHGQCLDATEKKPRCVGIHSAAEGGASFVNLLEQVMAAGDDSADQV